MHLCYVTGMTTTAKKAKKASGSEKSAESTITTQSVGVRELRQSASKILDQVKDGVVFEITEHGVPVARLVPITKSLYGRTFWEKTGYTVSFSVDIRIKNDVLPA